MVKYFFKKIFENSFYFYLLNALTIILSYFYLKFLWFPDMAKLTAHYYNNERVDLNTLIGYVNIIYFISLFCFLILLLCILFSKILKYSLPSLKHFYYFFCLLPIAAIIANTIDLLISKKSILNYNLSFYESSYFFYFSKYLLMNEIITFIILAFFIFNSEKKFAKLRYFVLIGLVSLNINRFSYLCRYDSLIIIFFLNVTIAFLERDYKKNC